MSDHQGKKSSEKINAGETNGTAGLHWETQLQHAAPIVLASDNWPLVPPIYQSVKFHNPDLESYSTSNQRYFYSRIANPTVDHLETMLAKLQGCEAAVALGSGIAAISTTLLALLKQGDEIIFFAESYRPTREIIVDFLNRFGITSIMLIMDDVIQDPSVLEKAIVPGKTRAVIFESPTNPMTRIAPFDEICDLAHRHSVLTILDGTLAGLHQNHHGGVDIYLHSLTKYAGGHGDVMGGIVLGKKEHVNKIRHCNSLMGATLDPFAASLILRGMKTYAIRYREESKRAADLAARLEKHPQVVRVFYPGLPSHPDFARLTRLNKTAVPFMPDYGSVFAFEVKSTGEGTRDRERITRLIRSLDIATLAPSLGSTETLVTPVSRHFAGDLSPAIMKRAGIAETTLRVSAGLEDIEDLWKQFTRVLKELDLD